MDFPISTPPTPPPSPLSNISNMDRKKLFMIIGGAVGGLGILAFLGGIIFSPSGTSKKSSANSSVSKTETGKKTSGSSENINEIKENNKPDNESTHGEPTYQVFPTESPYRSAFLTDIPPSPSLTPTPTHLPGPFYIANGQQNDLVIRIWQEHNWSIIDDVQLINNKTKEIRIIGRVNANSIGDSAFFYQNFSKVIFIGSAVTDSDHEKISIYSIPQNKIIKQYSVPDMKKALPSLQLDPTAILGRLFISPDGRRAAISYGKNYSTNYDVDPNTSMIVIDLSTNKMTLLSVKGLVKGWKDNNIILYQTTTSDHLDPAAQEITL